MTRRPEIDVLVLVPAIALAGLPLVPVFGPVALLRGLVGGVVVGTLVALVSARLRWGVWVSVAVAFAAFLVAVPGATLLHVLPRPEGVWQVLTGAVTSWKQVVTLEPELGTSGNTLVAPFLLGTAASLGALSLALRSRARAGAFAALVPPVVLVVSTLLGTKVAVGPVVSGLVLVVALTSWASWRCGTFAPRRVLSLALVVAVVGALGAVTGPWVATANPRYVLRDEIVPPFDPTSQASPLSAFRKFVKDWSDTPLLTVRGLPAGGQVRLATMDAFDGVVWNVAGAEAAEGSGTFRRVGSEVDTQERCPSSGCRPSAGPRASTSPGATPRAAPTCATTRRRALPCWSAACRGASRGPQTSWSRPSRTRTRWSPRRSARQSSRGRRTCPTRSPCGRPRSPGRRRSPRSSPRRSPRGCTTRAGSATAAPRSARPARCRGTAPTAWRSSWAAR
jgi:hypothetical protein